MRQSCRRIAPLDPQMNDEPRLGGRSEWIEQAQGILVAATLGCWRGRYQLH
jgi:hypothetical protein